VTAPDLLVTGEDPIVDVELPDDVQLKVTLRDERGSVVDARVPRPRNGHCYARF